MLLSVGSKLNFTLSYSKSMLSILSMSFTVLSTMEHEKKPRERFFICGLIEYSWPLNNVSVNCADPLIHRFFPSWLMQFIWPRQFKPRLFKGHLVVGNPHVWSTDLSYWRIFALMIGISNFWVIQGSPVFFLFLLYLLCSIYQLLETEFYLKGT